MIKNFVAILVIVLMFSCNVQAELLGIRWHDSKLVSFDPYSGSIINYHGQLNSKESFRGLAYNPNQNMLYALSQVDWNLYSINPNDLDINFIGKLQIDRSASWGEDIGGLTYNPFQNKFYTSVSHFDAGYTNSWSELVEVNVNSAEIVNKGYLTNGFVSSLSFNPDDSQIYAYATYGLGKSSLVQIDPSNAYMTTLFETPYHTIMGLAKDPNDDSFYSWINWTNHLYGKIDVSDQTVTLLGYSDPVGVASDAMIYRDFDIALSPVPIPGAVWLLGSGVMGLIIARRKKR